MHILARLLWSISNILGPVSRLLIFIRSKSCNTNRFSWLSFSNAELINYQSWLNSLVKSYCDRFSMNNIIVNMYSKNCKVCKIKFISQLKTTTFFKSTYSLITFMVANMHCPWIIIVMYYFLIILWNLFYNILDLIKSYYDTAVAAFSCFMHRGVAFYFEKSR